jgi:tetratricopeptide (TPR) repeat protein
MHRGAQVIPIMVDGSPGHPLRDCFPDALRFKLSADRQPSDECGEPIPDARPEAYVRDPMLRNDTAFRKNRAVQRVVARLLGLPSEEIERRATRAQRRALNIRRAGMVAVVAALIAYENGISLAHQELTRNEALLDRAVQGVTLVADTALAASQRFGLPKRLQAGILDRTEKVARELLDLGGETPHVRYLRAALLIDLARHSAAIGGDAAPARATEADRLMRSLALEVPGNPAWQRDLSATYDRLGDVLQSQGLLKDALAAYRLSAAMAGRNAAEPGDTGRHSDLATSLIKAGDTAVAQGALDEALESYQSSLAIGERLTATHRADPRWQYGLLLAREKIGDVQRVQGELDQALASYHASRAIAEERLAADPGNLAWRRALSVAWIKIGDVLALAGKGEDALASYRTSNAMAERVTAAAPSLASWQNHLATSHDRIGSVLHAQGDLVGALREYRTSVVIASRAAVAEPRNSSWQRDLATAYEHAGEVLQALGNFPGAQRQYEAKRAIIARLAEAEPANSGWRYDLGISHARIGFVLEARGNFTSAASEYEACLQIGRRFAAADPANPRWQRDLAVSYQRLANVHHRLGKTAQALAELRRGRDLMEAVVVNTPDFAPDAARWTADLARFDTNIAALRGQPLPSQAVSPGTIPRQAAKACDGLCPAMAPAASNVSDHGGTAPDGTAQDIAARAAAASVIVASDLRSRIEAIPATTSKLDN